MNYLITFAVGAVIWIITGLVMADYLSETISLATMTIEDFLLWYRITITVAGLIALFSTYYWFHYGSKDEVARNLDSAKYVWNGHFIAHVILAVVGLLVLVVVFLDEGLLLGDYSMIFSALSLHTYIFFWLCTFLMSPTAVKYLVPLKS